MRVPSRERSAMTEASPLPAGPGYGACLSPGGRLAGGRGVRNTAALQVAEDRHHPAVLLPRGGDAELGEDARDVLLGAALRDLEPLGDREVRAALGHQREHVTLTRR